MKAVILAGGYGSRISEESILKPKPMIEIGGKPILWHIMKIYSYYGIREFIICAGYKQHIIKQWFADYFLHNSDITYDFTEGRNETIIHNQYCEPWRITIVDTGLDTMTGGRVKRIQSYIGQESFCLTYGDGVANIDLKKLIDFHNSHGKTATLTMVSMAQFKGVIDFDADNMIHSIREKDDVDGTVINGGYMVCSPKIFDYLEDDSTILEKEPLKKLAAEGELMGYYHDDFWQCMDTKKEMDMLNKMWISGKAPWKVWED